MEPGTAIPMWQYGIAFILGVIVAGVGFTVLCLAMPQIPKWFIRKAED